MDLDQPRILGGIVDRIATIHAQIKELQDEADGLRAALIEADQTFVAGQYHQAVITCLPGKVVTDWQAIAKRLNPSAQLVRAHTRRGESFYRVCISDISVKVGRS